MFALLFTLSAFAQAPDIQVDLHLDTVTIALDRLECVERAHPGGGLPVQAKDQSV